MYLGPTPGLVPDEVRARLNAVRARDLALLAARDQALTRIARGAALVALVALIVFGWLAGPVGTWAPAQLFGGLFVVLLGLAFGQRLPFVPRAVAAVVLFYAAGLAARLWLGLDSASWIFLGGCAALAALLFGTRPGLLAAVLALATWGGLTSFAGNLPIQPLSPAVVVPLAWLLNSASLAMVLVALILPQRQFVEGQAAAAIAAQVEAGLHAETPAQERPSLPDQQPPASPTDQDLKNEAPAMAAPAPLGTLPWLPVWLQDRWGFAGVAAAGYVLLYALLTLIRWGGPANVAPFSDVAVLPLSLFAAVCAWRVAGDSRLDAPLRSAWLILGFAVLTQFFADLIWFFLEIVFRATPTPSIADIFYLSIYPLTLWGVLSLPSAPVRREERTRFWGALLGGVAITAGLVWQFIVRPIVAEAGGNVVAQFIGAAYPIGDVALMGAVLANLLRRPEASVRSALRLYLAGLVAFFAADLVYALANLTGGYESGGWLDLGWVLAYLLFAWAALRQSYATRQARGAPPAAAELRLSRTPLNYASFGFLFGLTFPLGATLLDIASQSLPLSFASAVAVQNATPLHWIIDTAPLMLGMAFGLTGVRQELAQRLNLRLAAEVAHGKRNIDDLQQLRASLEQQVTARTADLEKSARQTRRRAEQLAVSAEVAREAAALRDLPDLLGTAVRLISVRFGYYHAGVFLLDETGEYAVLKAANSPGGQKMLARNHRLRVGAEGIVGYVTETGEPRIAFDVGADAVHFVNPDLLNTHSEMALPLKVRGKVIGALDVQSTETNAFSDEDVQTLQSLASLLAVAIDNVRLLAETQSSLEESRALQQAARHSATGAVGASSFRYDGVEVEDLGTSPLAEHPADPGVLQVPISLGGEALGMLEIKRSEQDWSADDIELTQAIASRMALALENARLFETSQVSLAVTERLYNASRAITAAQTLEDVLRAVINHAVEPPYSRFVVALAETGPDRRVTALTVAAVWDERLGAEFTRGMRYTEDALPIMARLQAGTAIVIPSLDSPDLDARSRAVFEVQEAQALAGIPLVSSGTVVGAFLAETRSPHQFTPEELRPLQALADLASVAIENLRLLEESQQRIAELVTINTLSQALTAQLDVQPLTELVGQRLRQTFSVNQAYVALYDPYTNLIEIPYLAEGDERLTIAPFPLGQGLASVIIKNRQPLLLNANAERQATELGAVIAGTMPKSFLGVPVFIGDQVVGVLSVQSSEREGLFTEADVRLLTTIAASTGVALQNARLFAETQQRLTELATINAIGQALTTQLNLYTLTEVVGDKILQAFNVSGGYIALYDSRTDLIEIPYFREGNEVVRQEPVPLGQGLASVIIRSRQPLLINHDTERRAAELGAMVTGLPTKSYLGVPILLGEEPIGVLSVQSHEREGLFTESDARLLATLANSLGVAVQNARLFAETQRRAQQLATAAEISRAANTVLDPDELIRQAAELIRERFELYYTAVFLVDSAGQWADLKHATGQAGRVLLERGHRLEVGGQSMVGTAISLRIPRIALDVGTEPVRFANPLLPDTRSEMALPLAVGDTVLGALNVQSIRPNAFAQADIAVLQTMADQLAIALQNARLFAATQSELAERRRAQAELAKVRLGLERSTEAVFITDVNGIISYANPAFEQVYGWKPEEVIGQTPRIIKSGVVPQERYKEFWSTLLNKQVVAGEIINKTKDGRLIPIEGANNPILDTDGKLIGFLAMHRDISERKRADAELQRRAQQLAAAADVGRAATSTLDLDLLLRDSVELIRDRFGFYHASVFLIEPGSRTAVVRESTGEAGRQLKERQHSLEIGSRSLVGQATANHEPMVVQDVTRDPTHFKNPLLPDTQAEAVVPMLAGDTVVGALDVQSTAANAFGESDISTLVTIADQLAVAVQNARLFERTRRQARREKLVVEITNKIRAAPDAESMLRTAVSELRQALGVREGMVRLSPVARAPAPPGGGNGHGQGEHTSDAGSNGNGHTPGHDNGSGEIL